jgi:hypothetical protein
MYAQKIVESIIIVHTKIKTPRLCWIDIPGLKNLPKIGADIELAVNHCFWDP